MKAQTTSSISKFVTPPYISGCNNDTIRIELTNIYGAKGVVYSGPVKYSVTVPGPGTIKYVGGTVSSVPAGATSSSPTGNTVDITVPMPALGKTTIIKFVVNADCNVLKLNPLPQFTATASYPTPYPITGETFSSAVLAVGNAQLNTESSPHYWSQLNNNIAFNTDFERAVKITNGGYGSIDNVTVTATTPNDLTPIVNVGNALGQGPVRIMNAPWTGSVLKGINPVSSTVVGNNTVRVYTLKGPALGPDGLLTPGETIFFDELFKSPNYCGTFDSNFKVEYTCAGGGTVCDKPQTLTSRITVAAGTPLLVGTKVSVEYPDGCPNKKVEYKVKNTATGNGAPEGNAYDVDLIVSMGGGLAKFTNIKLNGVTVPLACLSTTAAATSVTIKLKDKMTTDPDGAGGISDIDGDGFFDDMAPSAKTTVSFEYSIPCDLACGANLYYQLGSNTTFTDFCRTLKGATNTALDKFGFQQVQAIEQAEAVDYGFFTATTAPVTKTAKYNFQYKALNMDLTAATAQLVINYSKDMEVTASSIKINGVAPTNAPVLQGTGATFGGTAGATDKDSAWVINLTPAEVAMLTDATPDNLSYDQTRYSCGLDRQKTINSDNWQLLFKTKAGLCPDGSTPCTFDLSCKQAFAYSYDEGCGDVPCYVNELTIQRVGPDGFTSVAQTTLANPIDASRSWVGDTILTRNAGYLTGDDPQEPNGFWTNAGNPSRDLRWYFGNTYTSPDATTRYRGEGPLVFLPGSGMGGATAGSATGSKICIRQRTPDPTDPTKIGTIGAILFEAPILVQDFWGGNKTATNQDFNLTTQYIPLTSTGLPYFPERCNTYPTAWNVEGLCPADLYQVYDPTRTNISEVRLYSADLSKVKDLYSLLVGQALARAGWTNQMGEDNYYIEVKPLWVANPDFAFNNISDWNFTAYGLDHYGDFKDGMNIRNSTKNGSCGESTVTHLTVTKELIVGNPVKAVYSSACGLKVCNTLFFKSQEGDYFRNGEVRVPYKLDSIVVDIPTEYGIVGGTTNMVYQSCTGQNLGTITPSASTGHVKFTNTAGGAFPYTDDCAGNKDAYKLCYDLQKTGTASPTVYKMPIKFYVRDEQGNVSIITDTASISEAQPILTLTPVASSVTIADGTTPAGKKCTTFYTDYKVTNNTLFDAPNVYLAAKGGTQVTICNIQDVNPATQLAVADTSRYGTVNMFGKIGTVKAGDTRIIRVYATTTTCSGKVDVCADFGCTYPAGNLPDVSAANTNLVKASTMFQAEDPKMQSKPIGSLIVTDLCATKTVEIEIQNTGNPNLFNMSTSTLIVPAGMTLVPGSVQVSPASLTGQYLYKAVPTANISNPSATQYVFDFKDNEPFRAIDCGLPGADEKPLNTIRVKFDVDFTACPKNGIAQLLFTTNATNYCGLSVTSKTGVVLDFVGSATPQNNFDLSHKDKPIKICSPVANVPIIVKDSVYVKNIGGYGTLSGTTAGRDTMYVSFPYDKTTMTMSSFVVGNAAVFGSYPTGADAAGNPQLKVKIPAGVAVGDSIAVPVTYTITPKVAKLCASPTAVICIYAEFRSNFSLDCAAKGLTCSATKVSVSQGLTPRSFLCCYGSIGDYVWNDTNDDGKQSAGELGVNGVKAYLYAETSAGVYTKVDSVLTKNNPVGGAAGWYTFDSLFTGNYKIGFSKATIPAGLEVTPKFSVVPETTDSDVDPTTVGLLTRVVPIDGSLASTDVGRNNPNLDLGLRQIPYGSIGDFVWKDLDKNGKQDTGEPGIKDVTVELYKTDASGAIVGAAIETTTTSSSGNYLFSKVVSGTYKVKFVLSTVPVECRVFTTKDSTPTDDAKDSDADPSTGLSQNITINAEGTGIAKDNLTIDAGFVLACVPPTTTATITPPTCAGATAQSNGMLRLSGFTTEKYQYSTGATFNAATAIPASPTVIPSNSVLISNLTNSAQTFTIRIYTAGSTTCFVDRTVSLTPVVCNCPPATCAQIGITIKN